jgi:hypothetical protein
MDIENNTPTCRQADLIQKILEALNIAMMAVHFYLVEHSPITHIILRSHLEDFSAAYVFCFVHINLKSNLTEIEGNLQPITHRPPSQTNLKSRPYLPYSHHPPLNVRLKIYPSLTP